IRGRARARCNGTRNKEQKKHTSRAVFRLNSLSPAQTELIAWFNETFVPHGFLPVDKITPAVREILDKHPARLRGGLAALLNDPGGWPRKRTFTALFWTRTAREKLARLPLHVLKQRRGKLQAERNRLWHPEDRTANRERRDAIWEEMERIDEAIE